MRNVFFCLLIGILFWGCSDENPSSSFAENSSCSAIEAFSSSIEDVESSSSVVESSSSEIIISNSSGISYGELVDERDGQVYKTVKIGDQTWMAENLNYAYTKPISKHYYNYETKEPIDSASFCYNNQPDSCAKYGRLYAWDLAMDCENQKNHCDQYHDDNFKSRGICPEKWHIPSVNEWNTLIDYVNNFATNLKSTSGWLDGGNGSDVFGFNLLPAGFYDITNSGYFYYSERDGEEWNPVESAGKHTCFWTQVQWTACIPFGQNHEGCGYEAAYALCISSKDREVMSLDINDDFGIMGKGYALSVRCVKDE